MTVVEDRILILTDLFLGALYADEKLTGEEVRAVRKLLGDLMMTGPDNLPDHVDARLREFSPAHFDLRRTAQDFKRDPPMKKRRLLELVAQMTFADGVIDIAEDDYLRELAVHLDMEPEEYADLVLDYEIEELRQSFEALRVPSRQISASP